MPLPYDPTGAAPGNFIVNEAHPFSASVQIVPAQGAFYKSGFVVRGYNPSNPGGFVLQQYVDFTFSPLYITYAQATAKEVFSYIILLRDDLDSVELDYHATGGAIDSTLFAEIADAGPFDYLDAGLWLSFRGQLKTMSPAIINPLEQELTFVEVLANKLAEIKTIVEAALTLPPSMVAQHSDLMTQLNGFQVVLTDGLARQAQYDVAGRLIKVIATDTYTVQDIDIGYTLIFTQNAQPVTTVTIDNGLPDGFWCQIHQAPGASKIDVVGTATFYNMAGVNGTLRAGETLKIFAKATDSYVLERAGSVPVRSEHLGTIGQTNFIHTVPLITAAMTDVFVNGYFLPTSAYSINTLTNAVVLNTPIAINNSDVIVRTF